MTRKIYVTDTYSMINCAFWLKKGCIYNSIQVNLSNKEIKNRLDKLPKFKQNIKSSYLRRYSKLVTSANTGAILKSN